MKKPLIYAAGLLLALALAFCLAGCGGQDAAKTEEAVIADGLAKINVK